MTDSKISIIIREFGELIREAQCLKDKGWQFKVNNYRKVINILKAIEITGTDVVDTEETLVVLREGGMAFKGETPPKWKSKILLKIEEIIQHGFLAKAEQARQDPKTKAIAILTSIPEIGPSKAQELYQAGITNLEQLLAHPELVNRKQLIGLRHYQDLAQRIPRKEMDEWSEGLTELARETLGELDVKISNMELVGSYRRGLETSGDIDFYLSISDQDSLEGLMIHLRDMLIAMEALDPEDIFSCGPHKLMCVARLGAERLARHLDIFIFQEHQYPFALMYATGSGEFNVRFRNHALQMGYSLSDKQICLGEAGGEAPPREQFMERLGKPEISCELDIFTFLGVAYIPPAERTPTVKFQLIKDLS